MADSKTLVVLNLGSQNVSGAVFGKTAGGDLILKRFGVVEMDGDPTVDVSRLPQLKIAIDEIADQISIRKQSAWFAVSGHIAFTRFVKLPPVQEDKVGQIVEFEARQNVPFPIDEVIWDYEIVSPPNSGEVEVVLVAMKADALDEINEQVADNGLKTSGVDLAPMATYNAFRYSYPEVNESVVVVDLGARSTNLVFVEGDRFFTRNILVGGASLTTAIAKEFNVGFGDAEQNKRTSGFVAQGGAVEEHPDPAVAALSKVIRNAMTRLHGEVLRTINYYKTQQGGSPPTRVFLCGGGVGLPGVVEFFEEKLKLPVEIFNPLRGVQMDRGVSSDEAASAAPVLSELVGLALRASGGSPCEVELVPPAVATARDASKRAPALITAMLCLWAALGAGIVYVNQSNAATEAKVAALATENNQLQGIARQIQGLDGDLGKLRARSVELEKAINDRSYWVRLLAELNNKFDTDKLWLTLVEPYVDSKSITPDLLAALGQGVESGSPLEPPKQAAAELHLKGLYRKNDDGQEVVYRFAKALAESEFFDAKEIGERLNDYVRVDSGVDEDRYAYPFEIRLPLSQTMQFKK